MEIDEMITVKRAEKLKELAASVEESLEEVNDSIANLEEEGLNKDEREEWSENVAGYIRELVAATDKLRSEAEKYE